ncbi:MAG: hypothetical protein ACTS4T_00325 [Candidatus Hodgkinia cicadicola]
MKSLTSDENRTLIKVINCRKTSSEVRKITKTPNERYVNEEFIYKFNVNRCNLNRATLNKNVLWDGKTKGIKFTLTKHSACAI